MLQSAGLDVPRGLGKGLAKLIRPHYGKLLLQQHALPRVQVGGFVNLQTNLSLARNIKAAQARSQLYEHDSRIVSSCCM